ncbi:MULTISPECIES: hypothetical protein [unclassified Gemella]|uniref:hypothetical protein n=1 Tax=unclassified Gemella TaxID=2624949 RepID=UPI001C05747F|nr:MULTISPECIES: hypothetical protein [unclassified Gemella]MBU0279028.1 hypothetical protein [Gemella sp. zg-1178]QWQ39100.1 hypothetical protein KMP11_01845 [Gemella sp. zg-570]
MKNNNYNFLVTGILEEVYGLTIKHLAQQYVQGATFCYDNKEIADTINIRLDFNINKYKIQLSSDYNNYTSYSLIKNYKDGK